MDQLKIITRIALLITLTFVVSCATRFGEVHYYQRIDDTTGETTNYYRLSIKGGAFMSSARYVSGFYDENAVDMFFNEIKIKSSDSNQPQGSLTTSTPSPSPGGGKVVPMAAGQTGSLVMILSNNASSVTNTIGEFAQSQVVAQAITNLANRNTLTTDLTASQFAVSEAEATAKEVSSLMALVPNDGGAATEESLLRVLNAIKRSVSPDKEALVGIDDNAKEWLENVR